MERQEALAIREIHPGSEACPPKKKQKLYLSLWRCMQHVALLMLFVFSFASPDLSLNENGLHNNNGTTLVVC